MTSPIVADESVVVRVDYDSQWGPGANAFNEDCGAASILMFLAWAGLAHGLTVDALARQTALRYGDVGLTCPQLVELAALHKLPTFVSRPTNAEMIRAQLRAGLPVLALVEYGALSNRLDKFGGGHFFVIVGFTGGFFIVNDPDFWSPYTQRGHEILYHVSEIEQGMALYGNQCVFISGEYMTDPNNQVRVLLAQIPAIVTQINAVLDGQAQTNPPPAPDPIPDGSILTTVKSAVNCRASASASAATINNGFGTGEEIVVSATTTPGGAYPFGGRTFTTWRAVTARKGKGGYVAEQYLSFP